MTVLISGISGTLTHKGSIIVSGSGFGTKPSPCNNAPYRYDNFEGGNPGDTINLSIADGGWNRYEGYGGGEGPLYNATRIRYSGTQSAYQNLTYPYQTYAIILDKEININAIPSDVKQFYASGWWYMEQGGTASDNVKVGSAGAWYAPDPSQELQTRLDFYPSGNSCHTYSNINSTSCLMTGTEAQDWTCSASTMLGADGNWHRFEHYLKLGSSGYKEIWVDLDSVGVNSGNFGTSSCDIGYIYFGHYYHHQDSSSWAKRYWDELYVDWTQARVEIGNAATWATCTHREIQIPSAWATGQITATINRGSFGVSDTGYLYVVDSDGNWNANGYPIQFGETYDGSQCLISHVYSIGQSQNFRKIHPKI